MMGSSPRLDVFGNEFGMGRAVAARSGYEHKFDGKVTLYPGDEGRGSMDLEICLSERLIKGLESDKEFLDAFRGGSD
ncbi:HXXXD-type acyl-transferase family protein [Actinidia rufa]|uniref:HXXXD-type acyl-transferase family protein n=1 Tax=Actinidia rufa TaxID=165716 RepID=A0A7J0E2B1_9ERIC|nr:HXXXD-type acyl-transferase family protein [Actinidia rufa]